MSNPQEQASPAQELGTLFVLIGIIIPLLSIAVVGGYGFTIWMYQLIAGPPAG